MELNALFRILKLNICSRLMFATSLSTPNEYFITGKIMIHKEFKLACQPSDVKKSRIFRKRRNRFLRYPSMHKTKGVVIKEIFK